MPWNKRTLALPASPPSVRLARDWVSSVLSDIGREELAESARLAVSELVTNAILHAEPPMKVNVRGTVAHPRIEVADQSMEPPRHQRRTPTIDIEDEFSWPTVGRGLDLVACYARRWGADIDPRGSGKVVWFEPSPEPRETPVDGDLFDLNAAVASRGRVPLDPDQVVTIAFQNMPVELFSHLRLHFNELGRELRLLAMSDPERYPIAVEFADVYLQVEQERRQVTGIEDLDRAMEEGRETVDLSYGTPPSSARTMSRINDLLDQIYESFADESLLAVRPAEEVLRLQRWYLGEFVQQAAGEAPHPWDGPTRLAARREVS